jgi:hypothetical protein
MSAREIVESVFTEPLAEKIWTANTMAVLPFTPQNVAIGSVLPAVFFMCRRGYRRGKGRFEEAFAPAEDARATIASVAIRLAQDQEYFPGFDKPVQRDILGDLLLCDALENKGHAEGHTTEVVRAFPVHFFSSWLDLPKSVSHMRFVPEMLVSLLANQNDGLKLKPGSQAGPFPVGTSPQTNLLFKIFARGVQFGDNPVDLRADRIDENADLSIEELLMVRVAQVCGEAPETMHATRGAVADIQNFWPIARRANDVIREDVITFLEHYGTVIPSRSIAPMLEALIGLSIAHASLASFSIAVAWDTDGRCPEIAAQSPAPLFVDASCGNNSLLRDLSEQSYEEIVRLIDQATISLAQIRILDAISRDDPDLQQFKPAGPDNSNWLNLLADVRNNRHETSALALRDLKLKLNRLAEQLTEAGIEPDAVDILRASGANQRPVHTIAEAVCAMMGEKILRHHYLAFLDSCLMVNEAHGLGRKRRVSRSLGGRKRKMMDLRSIILSNTVLEALVHLHLAARQRNLSFADFIRILRERYGLWVDEAPPGVPASREDLLTNRASLERRLRDLGLLVGVNDAEFMKHLRPRFNGKTKA